MAGKFIEKFVATGDDLKNQINTQTKDNKNVETSVKQVEKAKEKKEKEKADEPKVEKKMADDAVVNDVIAGKYGTGNERKTKLSEAGYDADDVQNKVNTKVAANTNTNTTTTTATTAKPTEDDTDAVTELLNRAKDTDEGQAADSAIKTGNVEFIGNIVDPETGEPVIEITYTADGAPIVKEIPEKERFSQGTAVALTLVSGVLSALTRGIVPPVNFMALRFDSAENRDIATKNKAIAQLNEQVRAYNDNVMKTKGTEVALSSAGENPELYSRENTDALARGKAAEAGNVALEQTEMNADLQKALQENGYNFDIDKMKLNNEQQIAMAELLYDQEVKKVFDTIKRMKSEGISGDDIARVISSMQGTTTLARGLGYAKDVTGMASNLIESVGSLIPGGGSSGNSDKNIKKYKVSNDNMLRKAWRRK